MSLYVCRDGIVHGGDVLLLHSAYNVKKVGCNYWDIPWGRTMIECNYKQFRKMFPTITLKMGEGPVEIDTSECERIIK
jgi:hypothetical protein